MKLASTAFVLVLMTIFITSCSGTQETLLMDETTIQDHSTIFSIKTSIEPVFDRITLEHEPAILRYNVVYRKDRSGIYKEYTIYFASKYRKLIVETIARLDATRPAPSN